MIVGIFVLVLFVGVAILGYRSERWHKFTVASLWWMLLPIVFPWYVKKKGMIRHWWIRIPLMFVAPCFLICYAYIVLIIAFCMTMGENETYEAASTNYHTAYDLQKATGVEFPEVVPVDSIQHIDFCNHYTMVKFVPKKKLKKKFFKKLDLACVEDSSCWRKCDKCYVYMIYPVRPLDRTKKYESPFRFVDIDGDGKKETYDWDGDYVRVVVPLKGDTITIEDGWIR